MDKKRPAANLVSQTAELQTNAMQISCLTLSTWAAKFQPTSCVVMVLFHCALLSISLCRRNHAQAGKTRLLDLLLHPHHPRDVCQASLSTDMIHRNDLFRIPSPRSERKEESCSRKDRTLLAWSREAGQILIEGDRGYPPYQSASSVVLCGYTPCQSDLWNSLPDH